MAKMRSPNYPAMGLRECVQRTKALWNREHRTAVPADVAARAIGYNGLSGPSRTMLASMKKYGLVDSDDKTVRVSDLGMRILHSADQAEELNALREAALKPELFQVFMAQYSHASDDAIRSYLITKLNFSEAGAQQAIKAYRDNYQLALLDMSDHNPFESEEGSGTEMTQNNDVAQSRTVDSITARKNPASEANQKTTQPLVFMLGAGVTGEVRIVGDDYKPEYFEALRKYLDLAKGLTTPAFSVGDTVEFEDAYTRELKWGRIDHQYGDSFIIRTIDKEEAGPNPKKFAPKPDARIADITGGTGIIKS